MGGGKVVTRMPQRHSQPARETARSACRCVPGRLGLGGRRTTVRRKKSFFLYQNPVQGSGFMPFPLSPSTSIHPSISAIGFSVGAPNQPGTGIFFACAHTLPPLNICPPPSTGACSLPSSTPGLPPSLFLSFWTVPFLAGALHSVILHRRATIE